MPENKIEELPEWAQAHIATLRQEAAQRRTEKQSLANEVATLTARVEELTQSAADAEAARVASDELAQTTTADLERERFGRTRDRLAAERGLPSNVAELVNATDEESLTTALDALAALRGTPESPKPEPNPAQGAGGQLSDESAKAAQAEEFFTSLE
ncbi:hypothetical protein ACFWHR_03915 [Leucobacter sp. NPDC058333]|uniref:hypothetical protein n=1 Tax=Leucobacter sp. NPDC058333 TaxID=3346450 RepID=UPI00364ACCAC